MIAKTKITAKTPTLMPALKIPSTALHELTVKAKKNSINP